jgi:phosphatidylethanolamine-binding protein (PEBP) family uncharacterized protein
MRMKPGTAAVSIFCAILLAAVIGGCGGGSSSATGPVGVESAKTVTNATPSAVNTDSKKTSGEPTPSKKAPQTSVPIAEIGLKVSNLTTANTCKGKNISPAISWGKLPPGTAELTILAARIKPVNGKLYYVWALSGVDPSLSGLKAGEVPKGVVLGRNSAGSIGYSLCPKSSQPEEYLVSAYVIPRSRSAKQGFNPLALRERATRVAKEVGLTGVTFPK